MSENRVRYLRALLFGFLFATACGVSNRNVAIKKNANDAGANTSSGGIKVAPGARSSSTGGKSSSSGTSGTGGTDKAQDGSGGTGGTHDTGGTGGSPDTGGSGGTGGDGGVTCDPTCSGDKPVCNNGTCGECLTGSARCTTGDTPEACEDGAWVSKTPCGGTSPACSNGTCGSVRLSGGIVTVGNAVLSAGSGSSSIRLVDYGLEYTGRICGMVKSSQVCVTGGVRP